MEQKPGNIVRLSINDTNVLKGLAILLMLMHHLFWVPNGLFDDVYLFQDRYLVNEIGIFSKLCVSLFIFLSGYGLVAKTEKDGGQIADLKSFYYRRFKKLYLNYWFVWLLFVPISVFYFGITFEEAYGSNVCLNLAADLLGIHDLLFTPVLCYNPSWWYYSCIIVMYLVFPVMYKLFRKDFLSLLLITIVFSFLPIPHSYSIQFYLVSFVLGMYAYSLPLPSNKYLSLALLVTLCVCRNFNQYPLLIDGMIVISVFRCYQLFIVPGFIKTTFSFLGKHSMNIFLFHVFFLMWFKDYVYYFRNPVPVLLVMLIACILVSIVLEWIKKYTLYKLC